MRAFACTVCGFLLAFENSVCLRCGTPQGYDPVRGTMVPVDQAPPEVPCANLDLIGCTWQVDQAEVERWAGLCLSCRLTRTRPPDSDTAAMAAFADTERAKRRLFFQLFDFGLPAVPKEGEGGPGLAFDLLSSAQENVVTGHADGVVTIDLAEGDDAHRESVRLSMGEPYRTMLGHLRHEVGHYYWTVLVQGETGPGDPAVLDRFRELFGDEREDYGQALQRHYSSEPAPDWQDTFVSTYATAHPWEDWAECFAHYLHIRDTLQSAAEYGVTVAGPQVGHGNGRLGADPEEALDPEGFEAVVDTWLPVTYALNAINRSMGQDDLYPFVLSPAVVTKLAFVHDLVRSHGR